MSQTTFLHLLLVIMFVAGLAAGLVIGVSVGRWRPTKLPGDHRSPAAGPTAVSWPVAVPTPQVPMWMDCTQELQLLPFELRTLPAGTR